MSAQRLWVSLPAALPGGEVIPSPYCLRIMDDQRPGTDEMQRRIAVKAGFRQGQRRDATSLPPNDYSADERRYFSEGVSLGLGMPLGSRHPFGELGANGGVPLLPFKGETGY